jgi:hypothetical protein
MVAKSRLTLCVGYRGDVTIALQLLEARELASVDHPSHLDGCIEPTKEKQA